MENWIMTIHKTENGYVKAYLHMDDIREALAIRRNEYIRVIGFSKPIENRKYELGDYLLTIYLSSDGYVYRVDVELVEKTREKMVKVHYRPKPIKVDNELRTALPLPGNDESAILSNNGDDLLPKTGYVRRSDLDDIFKKGHVHKFVSIYRDPTSEIPCYFDTVDNIDIDNEYTLHDLVKFIEPMTTK